MAQDKRDELKAGLFIIGVLALLVGIILWLGLAGLFATKGQEVAFYLPDSSPGAGISKGSAVVIAGQKIGMVHTVNFDPENHRTLYVARLISKDIKVYANGEAQAASALVGDAQVAITNRGTPEAPLADSQNPILVTGGIQQTVNDMAATVQALRKATEEELDRDDPTSLLSEIHTITDNLGKATGDLAVITAAIREEVDRDNPDSFLAKGHGVMDGVVELTPKVNAIADDLTALLAELMAVVDKINSGEGSIGAMVNDPALYKNLVSSAKQMELLISEMRDALELWKTKGIPMQLK